MLGLTQTTDGEGGKLAHFSYLFRKGTLILMVGVRGRPDVTKMDNAVSLAILVSGRVDKALGSGPPPPAGPPAPGAQPSPPRSGPAERVRIVNVDGGTANVRAEPSASADVVAEIAEGTVLDIAGPNRDSDGRTWRNVRVSASQTGWVASTLVETVSAPPPPPGAAPGPSPAPSPAAGGPPPTAGGPPPPPPGPLDANAPDSDAPPPDPGPPVADPPPPPPPPSASPAAAPSGSSSPSGSGTTGRGTGNGITVEIKVRDAAISSGQQSVNVKVTRDGGPVSDAFVEVTAKLDATHYRALRAPQTGSDGTSEMAWDMEGPAGTYQVIVDARTSETGPATSATASFRWK